LPEDVACSLTSDVKIDGDFPATSYRITSSGACLDKRCMGIAPNIESQIEKAFTDSAACLKNLAAKAASKSALKAMKDALAGAPLDAEALQALRGSAAARNAVQLERLERLDSNFWELMNHEEQRVLTITNGRPANATPAEAKVILGETAGRRLRLHCFDPGTKFTYVRETGAATLAEPYEAKAGFSLGAEASSPGMPSWPMIAFDQIGLQLHAGGDQQALSSILLHELMHSLGYTHDSKEAPPLFSACQICCFPKGLREDQLVRPACEKRGKGSLYAMACNLCSGATPVKDFARIEKAYLAKVKDCYKIGNPL
jgi:hypothetical protein